jgi:RNA-directed DNA polymerase
VTGRAGKRQRSPYPPRDTDVNPAGVQGRRSGLPRETCRQATRSGNPNREVGLRRQGSAEAIVPPPSRWEGLNVERDRNLSSSRDERRRQTTPDRGTTGQAKMVKPSGVDQRAERSPARDKGESNAGGGSEWGQVLERGNLYAALKRVEANGGAPGIDGMTVEELRPYLKEHWLEIRESLEAETYRPSPVRRVERPKPGGGNRLLGIPTVLDRFIQQAVGQVLTPQFERRFSSHSYGFRPGRGAHDAVKEAQGYIREGYTWVVDMDLEKFFDRINHDKLMARVARVVKDKRVLRLIRRYLESGVMVNGVVMERGEGTPQGGPLSPLLANIMLDDLDKELEKRGHRFVRYADDCNIYVRSKRAGERVMNSVREFLEQRLSLKVNERKSAVDRPWRRKFLGFSFYWRKGEVRVRVAKQALDRCRNKLRRLTRRTRAGTLEEIIQRINVYTMGWTGYYRLADTPSVFEGLDGWLRRRLRQLVWKRWKRGKTRWRELVALGVPRERAALGAVGTSPWRMAATPVVHEALSNAYWRKQGLRSITERYHQLRSA